MEPDDNPTQANEGAQESIAGQSQHLLGASARGGNGGSGQRSAARFQREPQPNSINFYAKTSQMQNIDSEKLQDLHNRLNLLLAIPVKNMKREKEEKNNSKKGTGSKS